MSDLIDRQVAIDALKKEQSHYAHEDGVEIFYEYNHAIKAIEHLPPAQPEPKRGKWIKNYKELDLCTAWWYECSECECEPVNGMLTAFCPYCGADMRGEEDGK